MTTLANHLLNNRAHVLRPRALALLQEDFSVFYTDHDLTAREALLQQVLYMFEIPRRVYETATSPRQFAIDLQVCVHRLKAISTHSLKVDTRVTFSVPNHDYVYTVRKILPDFLLELSPRRIAHPLWVMPV